MSHQEHLSKYKVMKNVFVMGNKQINMCKDWYDLVMSLNPSYNVHNATKVSGKIKLEKTY